MLIIFGWGQRSRTQQLSTEQALMLTYGYFHIFWLFQVAFRFRYSLATFTESGWATRELSDTEATTGGAQQMLSLGWWWRWGLLVGLGAAALIWAFATVTQV